MLATCPGSQRQERSTSSWVSLPSLVPSSLQFLPLGAASAWAPQPLLINRAGSGRQESSPVVVPIHPTEHRWVRKQRLGPPDLHLRPKNRRTLQPVRRAPSAPFQPLLPHPEVYSVRPEAPDTCDILGLRPQWHCCYCSSQEKLVAQLPWEQKFA